jgi:excisionase family DNA binding protein
MSINCTESRAAHIQTKDRNSMARNRRERRHPERIGIQEAAERYDVVPRTVRRWIAMGLLNGYRVGPKLIKIDVEELEKMRRPVGGGAA